MHISNVGAFLSRVFFGIQFPIADARPFIADAGRLAAPEFLWPAYEKDFVRSFGSLVPRPEGGIAPWAGEETYVRARNAVRFDGDLRDVPLSRGVGSLSCAYRRLHTTGGPAARVEVALWGRLRDGVSFEPAGEQLREFLQTQVRVRAEVGDVWGKPVDLVSAGSPLARHVLRARAPLPLDGEQPWWVVAGDPAVFIERAGREPSGAPPYAKSLTALRQHGIDIYHWHVDMNGTRTRVWLLRYDETVSPQTLRELRVHLSRLHAERQCLGGVLRAMSTKKVAVVRGTEESDSFQAYLLDRAQMLLRRDALGIDQTEILAAAAELSDLVDVGQRESLLALVGKIRPNVLRQVERLIEREKNRAHIVQINVEGDYVGEQVIIKGNTIYNGNLVVAKTIQNSFNTLQDSSANDELRAQLEELHTAVGAMAEKLDPKKAEEVARDLESLTKEATAAEPRRKWYEFSGEGLIEAAKAVADVGPKVIALVGTIVKMLALGVV